MNIVKLKDIILTEENAPQLTEEQRELFNTKFRGRYVYVVNWKYCVPLEDMTAKEYAQLSRILTKDNPGPEPGPYIGSTGLGNWDNVQL
jgi:hypothetical protein